MPDTKITALTALTAADPANDVLPIVDVSDTTMAASGTTKKISINNVLGCSGTATLASATITGDLTVATNRFAVSASGVGIGTTTMTYNLNVTGAAPTVTGIKLINTSGTSSNLCMFSAASAYSSFGVPNNAGWLAVEGSNPLAIGPTGNGGIVFVNNGSEAMRLNSNGLGIGVTPSVWDAGLSPIELKSGSVVGFAGSVANYTSNAFYQAAWKYKTTAAAAYYQQANGSHVWNTAPSGTAGTAITWTQAMTLDASGNLLVGTTTTSGNAGGLKLSNVGGTLGQITFSNNSGVADYVARFNYGSTPTLVGTITVASGGTTYNTTSDYRLKESVQPLVGGLARVSALKPSIYKWKSDGSSGEGFLAHELAEVVPFAVTGEKDAVNEDGSVKAQGVDLSRVVPILVAAIQELAAEVNALKNA